MSKKRLESGAGLTTKARNFTKKKQYNLFTTEFTEDTEERQIHFNHERHENSRKRRNTLHHEGHEGSEGQPGSAGRQTGFVPFAFGDQRLAVGSRPAGRRWQVTGNNYLFAGETRTVPGSPSRPSSGTCLMHRTISLAHLWRVVRHNRFSTWQRRSSVRLWDLTGMHRIYRIRKGFIS